MKRVYKCEYCYLKNARPCYECSACMSGDDHFRPAKPEKKRTTNADRIRAMSDEELAEQLIQYRDDWADYCTHKGCYATQKEAVEAETEWLKQPAEER